MDDSRFLRDLARTARKEEAEEQQRWERWERLSDGDLVPEELAELRAEDEMAFEAFRPLGPDFNDRVFAKIGPLVKPEPPPVVIPGPDDPPVWKKWLRAVREGFTFPWWRLRFVGPGLAAAAAALYFTIPPPPMPKITIANLRSSIEISRGGEGASVLLAGTGFRASANPSAKLSSRAKVESRCYVQPNTSGERKLRLADCTVVERNSRTGAPKIEGHLPEDLPIGPATLWIVIAYRGNQPRPNLIESLPADTPTRMRNWAAVPALIEVRAP